MRKLVPPLDLGLPVDEHPQQFVDGRGIGRAVAEAEALAEKKANRGGN